jgi:DNA-directed RNA polymerase specialized sigma24 family protein
MTPHQYQALIRLQPRLRRAIISRFGLHDADDLVQEANVGIIERASADPTYLVQQPAYVVRAGLWRAGDALRRELAYQKRTAPLEATGERASGAPASAPDLLEAIAVREAVAGLSATQRAVAAGLAAGQRRKEIAAALGVRPQSLAWHYGKLRRALAGVA